MEQGPRVWPLSHWGLSRGTAWAIEDGKGLRTGPWAQGCPGHWDLEVQIHTLVPGQRARITESKLTLQSLFTFSGTGTEGGFVASDPGRAGS